MKEAVTSYVPEVNSLEKAAIGRRVSETEFDLMNMIKNKNFL